MITQLQPPIVHSDVEVLSYDTEALTVTAVFSVYMNGSVMPKVQTDKMKLAMRKALQYMELEGFIPPAMTWKTKCAVVIKNKSTKN